MHRLFLDSNSYLGFYSLTEKDINQLAKLAELLELGKLTLLLPTQVISTTADLLSTLTKQRQPLLPV